MEQRKPVWTVVMGVHPVATRTDDYARRIAYHAPMIGVRGNTEAEAIVNAIAYARKFNINCPALRFLDGELCACH